LPLTTGLKPYWGKPAVRNFREEEGNVMQDLMAICHQARKGGYNGSHRSKHRRAFSLLDSIHVQIYFVFSSHCAPRLGGESSLVAASRAERFRAIAFAFILIPD